jgi:hypothetical protein
VTSWSDNPKTAAGVPGSQLDPPRRHRSPRQQTVACEAGLHHLCSGVGNTPAGETVDCTCGCHVKAEPAEPVPFTCGRCDAKFGNHVDALRHEEWCVVSTDLERAADMLEALGFQGELSARRAQQRGVTYLRQTAHEIRAQKSEDEARGA